MQHLLVVWVVLVANSLLPLSEAVWLDLPSTGTKCVSEEIQNKVVVLGDYAVISNEGHPSITVSSKVTSPYGNVLHHQENVTHGQFAFTTSEIGQHVACFWVDGHEGASLNLEWKIGVDAKDWDAVAKKEKIQGVELELRKLDDVVESIHENLLYLKQREEEMREVSEKTNARVAWFSVMSLGTCIAASAAQVLYLKRYFRKKKLI